MNNFKFAYGKGVWILLALAIPLAAAGLGWNIYNLVYFAEEGIYKILAYGLSVLICGALLAFCISVAVYGRYVFKNGCIYLRFGFVYTKTKAEDVVRITHFIKSDKLVIYFKDAKYSVVVIAPELYKEFISAVKALNPNVITDVCDEQQENG